MLTISRLSRWSINYYNDTANQAQAAAMDRQAAGGGLGEYYSERDTRVPTWIVAGDTAAMGELTGLDAAAVHGGFADTAVAARWLDDGIAPNGASGRVFTTASVHGFDLTFAAPKSVSLLRSLTDDIGEKTMLAAHQKGIDAAMTYLHEHAGYTRVHNPATGKKDLRRLPALVGIAYQHETSRCGDPHLHTHVIVPNRQARADGTLVSIDSKSLFHEAKAAGVIYQAVVRHELHAAIGAEWATVDGYTGMAEIAGVTKRCLKAWARRSSRLREWAHNNLVVVDGEPSAQQLAAAQKATRPAKPESKSWAALTEDWRADARGLELDRAAHFEARAARRAAPRMLLDTAKPLTNASPPQDGSLLSANAAATRGMDSNFSPPKFLRHNHVSHASALLFWLVGRGAVKLKHLPECTCLNLGEDFLYWIECTYVAIVNAEDAWPSQAAITAIGTPSRCIRVPHVSSVSPSENSAGRRPAAGLQRDGLWV